VNASKWGPAICRLEKPRAAFLIMVELVIVRGLIGREPAVLMIVQFDNGGPVPPLAGLSSCRGRLRSY
jgi:hypothetical protein